MLIQKKNYERNNDNYEVKYVIKTIISSKDQKKSVMNVFRNEMKEKN